MSQDQEQTNFSTEPTKWYFSLDGQPYVLREATEDAHIAYKNTTMQSLQITEGKGGSFTGGAEADAILLQRCLFKVEGSQGQPGYKELPVPIQFVKGLKLSISRRLYQWVRKNSGMDEEEETIEVLERRIKQDQSKLFRLKKEGGPGKDISSSTENI